MCKGVYKNGSYTHSGIIQSDGTAYLGYAPRKGKIVAWLLTGDIVVPPGIRMKVKQPVKVKKGELIHIDSIDLSGCA